MPFNVPSIRIAQASPSISLEKGSYRLRAPPTRTGSSHTQVARSKANSGPVHELVPASYEKRMALLATLLAFAMIGSFGAAYYLWTTSVNSHITRRHP
ncbi:hypothetical protein BD311DRAFT_771748 [Dichomitus squalens]|uniref:Uncharacterized protein n=1 Tax=Dichomitus squalens TaxID=114155 RepID=A0A4Q9M767_9APHY|nr:hypothetical protein BD311DRAFT_771748 [Dichomitus squalens]TBU55742.1 hypothetical protein BD310DRAFT_932917 [Dichomitus squalens]